jgi:hypothetical protein
MNHFKKKYPRQDPLTREWFFNGKWHDHYPGREEEEYNQKYDQYMEEKLDYLRDEGKRIL